MASRKDTVILMKTLHHSKEDSNVCVCVCVWVVGGGVGRGGGESSLVCMVGVIFVYADTVFGFYGYSFSA